MSFSEWFYDQNIQIPLPANYKYPSKFTLHESKWFNVTYQQWEYVYGYASNDLIVAMSSHESETRK